MVYIQRIMSTGKERSAAVHDTPRWPVFTGLLVLLCCATLAFGTTSTAEQLANAQQLLDAGDTEAALRLLNRLVKQRPPDAQALLLRSTAFFIQGEVEAGKRDLLRCLEIDPSLRQAWLNKAALNLSQQQYPEALEALERARELDPAAPDNELNIGVVLLLEKRLEEATESFRSYLERSGFSADASYLVASNYAMAGYPEPALEHLRRAIEVDEKSRLRARTDVNFRDLEADDRFQRLLNTDAYRPPPGSYQRVFEVAVPYDSNDSLLLQAVLDALQFSAQPFDRRVEVTPDWALIWGAMRIKLFNGPAKKGSIALSAPAEAFTPSEWQQTTDALLQQITVRLVTRGKEPRGGVGPSPGF